MIAGIGGHPGEIHLGQRRIGHERIALVDPDVGSDLQQRRKLLEPRPDGANEQIRAQVHRRAFAVSVPDALQAPDPPIARSEGFYLDACFEFHSMRQSARDKVPHDPDRVHRHVAGLQEVIAGRLDSAAPVMPRAHFL